MLPEAVTRLADELRLLREVIDELREDISWVTRNGLPIQPIEHVIIHRMALDPTDPDWNQKLQLTRCQFPHGSGNTVDPDRLEQLATHLVQTFEGLAQGQLEAILTALDQVRGQLATAFTEATGPDPVPVAEVQPTAETTESSPRQGTGLPSDAPPGCLF